VNTKPVSTIAQFCDDHDISRTTFYELERTGKAPRTMKVGRRKLISQEAQADWRRTMEEENAQGDKGPA